jgi:subtilisin family serine protease
MAKKRVTAYFFREDEQEAAGRAIEAVRGGATESYIVGDIEESEIETLRNNGLIVEVVGEPKPADAPAHRGFTFESVGPREVPEVVDEFENPNLAQKYFIQIDGPLLLEMREALNELSDMPIERVEPNAYLGIMNPNAAAKVDQLDFVKRIQRYSAKEQPATRSMAATESPQVTGSVITYDIRLSTPDAAAAVLEWLAGQNALVVGRSSRKVRVQVTADSNVLDDLMQTFPGQALTVEPFVPPKLQNDRARELIGVDRIQNNPGNPTVTQVLKQTGKGQIIGVADTGLDDTHPDFNGRIHKLIPLGRAGDASDPHGHGTHVAGSVLGDGSSSSGAIRGIAPEATLYFQSVLTATGTLGGLPLDLNDLFQDPYDDGVRIHNNSWGADTKSQYRFTSMEVDEFVANHRDMLIVIAAGNEGTAASPRNSQPGFVDWLSIDSPASSKNALTVGASRSDRTDGGFAKQTYKLTWPGSFPLAPIGDDKVSGNPEGMAAFSSRGPCDDRRIKPDLVAPGTDIVSTRSSKAPTFNFWAPFAGHNGRYAYMGGTSMASPITAGAAALVRQFFLEDQNHKPSAALLKATLINGTRQLTGQDSIADHNVIPNYHQGFGKVQLEQTIPNDSNPDLQIRFNDEWDAPNGQRFTVTGQRKRFQITVGDKLPLRICMAYTDVPARALQNNLNLFLLRFGASGPPQKWVGNENLPLGLQETDPENNVEILRVDQPEPGNYIVQISASNLLSDSQDFALVVTGDLKSDLQFLP